MGKSWVEKRDYMLVKIDARVKRIPKPGSWPGSRFRVDGSGFRVKGS
jgi:hypothetical protein